MHEQGPIPWKRVIAAWLALIIAESVHGVLRAIWLVPAVGEVRASQIGFATGMAIVLGVALVVARWLQLCRARSLLWAGALWMALTLVFEVVLGRLVRGYSWSRILAEFDPTQGGLMGFGLVWVVLAPLIAARLRGLTPARHAGGLGHLSSTNKV